MLHKLYLLTSHACHVTSGWAYLCVRKASSPGGVSLKLFAVYTELYIKCHMTSQARSILIRKEEENLTQQNIFWFISIPTFSF